MDGPITDHRRLPLNRKERFYTGTVLPMIVAADGFAHLGRFLELCGLSDCLGLEGLEFSTEYSLVESVMVGEDRTRFSPLPPEKDTPDVVLTGPGWLLVVEAKMFDQPSSRRLVRQLRDQERIVECMRRGLRLPESRVRHVVLLPAGYEVESDLDVPVVRWEQVLESYRDVGPAHWIGVLDEALRRHAELVSPPTDFARYAEALMSGGEIVHAHRAGTLPYVWMGRKGGLAGTRLSQDLAAGKWRGQRYQVATEGPASPNWFAIGAFVALVEERAAR